MRTRVLTLIITFFALAGELWAQNTSSLNPYAYGLSSSLSTDQSVLTVNWSLNAPATSVKIIAIDSNDNEYTLIEYGNTNAGSHTSTIDMSVLQNLPKDQPLTWRVDVKGDVKGEASAVKAFDNFSKTTTIDVDNNPESANFGTIFCNYGPPDKPRTRYLYAFTPAFESIQNPELGGGGFWGVDDYYAGTITNGDVYAIRRIRVADDGRIFATSTANNGTLLWEINKTNFNQCTAVITAGDNQTLKFANNGTNNTHIEDQSQNFVAGPNLGFDVKGSGENLELVMLSFKDQATPEYQYSTYALGTADSLTTKPTTNTPVTNDVNLTTAQVQYFKGTPKVKAQAFRYNHDSTKVVIAEGNTAKVYAVDETGEKIGNELDTIPMQGYDFAWDRANNIFVAGYSKVAVYAMPQGENGVSTPAASRYAFTLTDPVPCIVAYDLKCKYKKGQMAFDFSFYANTQPTSGVIRFFNLNGETIQKYTLTDLQAGTNTITLPVCSIPKESLADGSDILWEVELTAKPSTRFAEIYHSTKPFHTAYATIDNSPESDFFGRIYVASQQTHTYSNTTYGGEIWRLVPTYENGKLYKREWEGDTGHRPNRPQPNNPPTQQSHRPSQPKPKHAPAETPENGFHVIFRPTVAPDGMVYLTDNGNQNGGVYVMDPHKKDVSLFYDGCERTIDEEWTKDSKVVGSGSTCAHIYWTETPETTDGFNITNAKLYLMHNTHKDVVYNLGECRGFFIYDLMKDGALNHTYNNAEIQYTGLQSYDGDGTELTPLVNDDATDYSIVGTSRGAWVCQLRYNGKNFKSFPSLTFYSKEGEVTIFSNSTDINIDETDPIQGSFGAALAVNKAETQLAMVDGLGNIMLFDINWDNNKPSLTNKQSHTISYDPPQGMQNPPQNTGSNPRSKEPGRQNAALTDDDPNIKVITTLNYDYAGNLIATIGKTYGDTKDEHKVTIYTLPKTDNTINVPARFSQRIPDLVEDQHCETEAGAQEPNTLYESALVYRPLQAGMYNTICLPFGLNTLVGTPYEDASVVKLIGSTEDKSVGGENMLHLRFQEISFQDADTMVAGMPYLIKPQQDIKGSVTFYNVYTNSDDALDGLEAKPAKSAVTFHGITDPTDLEKNPRTLFLVANNRLATPSATSTMLGNRGYFTINEDNPLPDRTKISIVKSTPTGNEQVYINPYRPEAYKMLLDGRIVIVRGGVMYDLAGQRIR